ncbi:hypothetical protein GCM10009678_17650 [Actinomadura kijaniata]|uniref:Anti-sigma factor antagonist n=1 Tax=Actinomadura namibiensis TaxID=182080 RepID=A0A7W3LIG9_ACTNM|nr:STAS domain-containing protein [Actinomadura namibiensis]MBA8948754.1 anti-anti-sigma factor [Actinomadura namibiensis]
MTTLETETRTAGQATVVSLAGELTINTVQDAEAVLRAAAGHDRPDLVLDLGGLRFMDSMGLRAVLHARRSVVAKDGRLVLAALQPTVARVLDLAGLREHITVCSTTDEALKNLRPR